MKNHMIAVGFAAAILTHGEVSNAAGTYFTDKMGLRWEPIGPVHYSSGPMTEPIEGRDEFGSESSLKQMSLTTLKEMYRPVMEIGGVEYTISEEQVDEFAALVLQRATRAESVGRGPERRLRRDPVAGPEAVFGTDERYIINHHAHREPYTWIAKTWSTVSGSCTAFKAHNHHTALTAAHCVHDGPNAGWRDRHQIQFAAGSGEPGGTNQAKYPLPSDCYGRVVPGGWTSTGERQYDYAVLYLHGRAGAWCNFDDYDVGYYGYREVTGDGISGYVSGYPGASSSPNGRWGDLWYAARSDGYQAGDTIRHTVDTSPGQSGSPFATRTDNVSSQFMGVHVASTTEYNIASRVQPAMINFIITYAGY